MQIDEKVSVRAIDTSFRGNFLKELQLLRAKTVEDIARGVEDYRYWVGYVRCIDDIIQMSDDVRKKLLER